MIAFRGGKLLANGHRNGLFTSFDEAVDYLHFGLRKQRSPSDRVLWSATRNLPAGDDREAAFYMRLTAAANPRVQYPGYHIGVALHPDESLSRRQWERVADRLLERLGLGEHQAILALHEEGHQHIHILVNRVGYDRRAWKPSYDVLKAQAVMREMELELGLRVVPTLADRRAGARLTGREVERHEQQLAGRRLRRLLGEEVLAAPGWRELDDLFARHGLRLEPAKRGGGVVVTDGDERLSLSKVDRNLSGPRLAERYGETLRRYRERAPAPEPRPRVAEVDLGPAQREAERVVDGLLASRATFGERDLEIATQHRPDAADVRQLAHAREDVVALAVDDAGAVRYAALPYVAGERRLFADALALAGRARASLPSPHVLAVLGRHPQLSDEQRQAVIHATRGGDLGQIAGMAGSGKTAVARPIVEAYRELGYDVAGAAYTGKAAQELADATGLETRTLDAWRLVWQHQPLSENHVLLVDEAGMLDVPRMAELIERVRAAGAKLILIGDPEQLKAIGPGDALRGLLERHPAALLTTVYRQREAWQREATRELAEGRVVQALRRYDEAGRLRWHARPEDAARALAEGYLADRSHAGAENVLALASTRAEVALLNDAIRARLAEEGELGAETLRHRGRDFAAGDRVVFTRNDATGRRLELVEGEGRGVLNGHLGTVEAIDRERRALQVRLDRGATVRLELERYGHLEHAYALTVHKAQGSTVDHAHVLAGPHADRHLAYVALSRHRRELTVYADRQRFPTRLELERAFGYRPPKDLITDYAARGPLDSLPEQARAQVLELSARSASWTAGELAASARAAGLDGEAVAAAAVELPEVVSLGGERYATRANLEDELALHDAARAIHGRRGARVSVERLAAARARHHLSGEQANAVRHALEQPLALVTGRAGSGKTRLTRALVELHREQGGRVLAAAHTGKAAEELGRAAGVASKTVAGWLGHWERGREPLRPGDLLLIDEAGLLDTRTLRRALEQARDAGARVVLLGDREQLPAIAAGDAFRALHQRYGSAELRAIHRQRPPWQRRASEEAARGRMGEALARYEAHGDVQLSAHRQAARTAMIDRYLEDRYRTGNDRGLLLAVRRADVKALNRDLRQARRDAGEIAGGLRLHGAVYAAGDRILFEQNDHPGRRVRTLDGGAPGVRNGTLGTVERVGETSIRVRLDDGRRVEFDPRAYARFTHGYAMTLAKAQGTTVDRAYLLADRALDQPAAYVGLTRHRHRLSIHVPRSDFTSREELVASLRRRPGKDLILDHLSEARARELLSQAASLKPPRRRPIRVPASGRARLEGLRRALDVVHRLDRLDAERSRILERLAGLPARGDTRRLRLDREAVADPVALLRRASEDVFARPQRARAALDAALEAHPVAAVLRAFETAPERFGRLRLSLRATAPARRLAATAGREARRALDRRRQLTAALEQAETLHRRLGELRRDLDRLGSRQEALARVAVHARDLSPRDRRALPEADRGILRRLRRDRAHHLRPLLRHLRRFERARAGSHAQRRAADLAGALAARAPRHLIYHLAPAKIRTLLRITTL
ncbi:MAG: hypothetical protein D6696_11320, partial [Acidobacteria bacterium]